LAESDFKQSILAQDYKIPVDENGSAIVRELYVMDTVENINKLDIDYTVSSEEDQLQHNNEKRRVRIITRV